MEASVLIRLNLVDVRPLQENQARWYFLRFVVVDKEGVVPEDVEPPLHGPCLSPDLKKQSLLNNI